MSDTKIEWTDETWNPTRGCRRVSEGCRNCYAERMATRQSNPGGKYEGLVRDGRWTGKVVLDWVKLLEPLTWKKPKFVFVDSMSDLFHEDIPDDFIDRVFAVMALTPHITYQILTKRPERAVEWFTSDRGHPGVDTETQVYLHAEHIGRQRWPGFAWDSRGSDPTRYEADDLVAFNLKNRRAWVRWPLPNVWVGVSVEHQDAADERIPLLQRIPAAVRFLSVEPLLGPVSIRRYLRPQVAPWAVGQPPATWDAVTWPRWVPEDVREQVVGFWGPKCHRRPADYEGNGLDRYNLAPAFGQRVTMPKTQDESATGRYVHAWNNMGRVVDDEGKVHVVSCHLTGPNPAPRPTQSIRWVIVGGESGHGARPMHPDWTRTLRDECYFAGVDFFFKQWGAWREPREGETFNTLDGRNGHPPAYLIDRAGAVHCTREVAGEGAVAVIRTSKKEAGRELDGKVYDEKPEVTT